METQETKNRISIPVEDGYVKSYIRSLGRTKEEILSAMLTLNPDSERERIVKYVDELFS